MPTYMIYRIEIVRARGQSWLGGHPRASDQAVHRADNGRLNTWSQAHQIPMQGDTETCPSRLFRPWPRYMQFAAEASRYLRVHAYRIRPRG